MRTRPFLLLLAGFALVLMAALHSGFLGSAIAEPDDSLVGYWQFDEGEGNTTADSSGNGNNGTLQNGPLWVDGIDGGALEFDGEDDYVEVEDSASLDLGSKLTFSAWIKLDSFPDNNRASIILSKYDTLDNQRSYMFFIRNTNNQISLRAVVADGTEYGKCNYDSIYPFQLDVFYHVAATYNNDAGDSNRWHLFVNGTEINHTVQSENSIIPKNSNAPLAIGKVFDGEHPSEPEHFFEGVIDEVTIWDRALSSSELYARYSSPVAHWQFDEGKGTTAYDSSGNGNDGALVNGPQWVEGIDGGALEFDGLDDYVKVNDDDSLNVGTGNFSFSVWVNVELNKGTDDVGQIYRKGQSGGSSRNSELQLRDYDGDVYVIGYAGTQPVISNGTVEVGRWYHIVFLREGSQIKLYINGNYDNSLTISSFNLSK